MAVSIADIQKIRKMTGAGLADCKKALTESNGDFDKAIEIIREKGQAIAAKRSDRETSNGCVLVKATDGFAAMIALKCETDFVANGKDFIALTQSILDAAVAAKVKTLDEVKALPLNGSTVQDEVVARSGITGEKTELDGYQYIEGDNVSVYDHMGKHMLCTMVQTNKPAEEQAHAIAMQVAAMNPVALDEASVPQEVKDSELKVAIEKTKEEQINKAVEAALKKAGFNLYIAENEEHINEGIMKGNITEAQAEEIRKIKKETAEQKAANMPEQMVQNIAKGRMAKFYKDSCLLNQEFIQDSKQTVSQYLQAADKELLKYYRTRKPVALFGLDLQKIKVSKLEQLNVAVLPVTFLFVIAFTVVVASLSSGDTENLLIQICSFVPFTSPMAMFVRIAMGSVPAWQILLSVGILVLSTIAVGFAAAAIYRAGVLMYGKPPKLRELVAVLREKA